MKRYYRGTVVLIDAPLSPGSRVQGGKRPFIVVQNNSGNRHSPTSIVVPLTTHLKHQEMPTHALIIHRALKPSMAMCEQVRVIDVTDDWKYICTLPGSTMARVDNALRAAFFYGEPCLEGEA